MYPFGLIRKYGLRIICSCRSIRFRRVCLASFDAVFYFGAKIENLSHNKAAIKVGMKSHILGELRVFPHGGKIEIGDFSYIGSGSKIWSMSHIKIGSRVQVSHNVNIHDNISHSLSAAERHTHFAAITTSMHPKVLNNVPSMPVFIEDDAWIGFNATILKGVSIGRGAVVGACSVVTKSVPDFAIVVGNPARIIGYAQA